MFQNLELFQISHAMARHAGTRQAIVARNIANADTPDYKALDVPAFADLVSGATVHRKLKSTRTRHLDSGTSDIAATVDNRKSSTGDPNGNTVSLEQELLKGVEVKRQHDRAVAIYKSSLTIMRSALGRR